MGRDHTLEFIYMTRWRLHGDNVSHPHFLFVCLHVFCLHTEETPQPESEHLSRETFLMNR